MRIHELAKELNIENGELIEFLCSNGFKVSSHMQKIDDKAVQFVRDNFVKENIEEPTKEKIVSRTDDKLKKSKKVFKADDEIICKSVTPWKLTAVGVDKNTIYHWEYFGDIDYVKYRDLQALRRTDYIMKPNIIIMDEDLRSQWSRELGDLYKYFDNIDYPEEYFNLPDEEFRDLLNNAPEFIKEIIKVTAMAMIRNKNYPSIQKISDIDSILGTCIREFI